MFLGPLSFNHEATGAVGTATGEVFQGIHEPIIEARTFQIVQDVIDGKDNDKVRRFDFTYRRLLTCGLCGSRLTGETQKGHIYYRCHTRDCETTGIREDIIDARLKEATNALVCGFRRKSAPHSDLKPATDSDLKSATPVGGGRSISG